MNFITLAVVHSIGVPGSQQEADRMPGLCNAAYLGRSRVSKGGSNGQKSGGSGVKGSPGTTCLSCLDEMP